MSARVGVLKRNMTKPIEMRLLNLRGLDDDQRFFAMTYWQFWLIRQSVSPEDEKRYKDTLIPPIDHLLAVHYALLSNEAAQRCELAKTKWQRCLEEARKDG